MSERAKFFSIVVPTFILGIVGIFCPEPSIRSIGEALFIAAFLAMTVDAFVKERLARQVSQDVMAAALGYHVPQEIRDEIREIASFRTIRRDVDLMYNITPYEGSNDHVWVNATLEFEIENLTDVPQPFRHMIWVQKPFRFKEPLQQVLYAKATGLGAADYELQAADLPQRDVPGEHAVEWCRDVVIQPHAKARFWSKSVQIHPAEHVDTFWLVQPTIGVKVRVYTAATTDVSVNFAHRRNDDKEVAAGNTWTLRAGFPPQSTITIEWRNKTVPPLVKDGAAPANRV